MAMETRKKVTMNELRERISERELFKLSTGPLFSLDVGTIKQLREREEVPVDLGHFNTPEYMDRLKGLGLNLGKRGEFNYSEGGKRPKIYRNENYQEA